MVGFLDEQRVLHPAAITADDLEDDTKKENNRKIMERLRELSDFGAWNPRPDFSLFEFYNRTGIQVITLINGANLFHPNQWA